MSTTGSALPTVPQTLSSRDEDSFLSLRLPLELGVIVFDEPPALVAEIEQPLPLFDVEAHGHALQSAHAGGALLADLALEGPAVALQDRPCPRTLGPLRLFFDQAIQLLEVGHQTK